MMVPSSEWSPKHPTGIDIRGEHPKSFPGCHPDPNTLYGLDPHPDAVIPRAGLVRL